MATYAELFDLHANDSLRNRVAVACVVKAQALLSGATPTQAQVDWATSALADPKAKAREIMYYVLAANKDASVAQITGTTDNAIQSNVNDAADQIIAGGP